MRKIAILFLFVLIISVVYIRYQPVVTYISGKIGVKLSQIGQVSGSSIYRLDVAFHRQEHALSCEIASLKMALSGVGLNISESDLISSLNFDPTPRSGGQWGDPYTGFVGNIDGKMLGDGYGVYWDPIARVGLKYRRTEVIYNGSLPQLLYHINQGRPVIVWGHFGRGNTMTWTTPAGKQITGINGEHVRVLIGYSWNVVSPEYLILLDPIYGELHWSVEEFVKNWEVMEKGAVVVYQQPRWVKTFGSNIVWEINEEGTQRHGLAMTWEQFISGGGLPEGINEVSHDWLIRIPEGEKILSLTN
ncbi:MAG: C39 family peptidase [Candidatus Doudnabacteria bacterium]|nr:C39 family peptidase [Candidatus Doudnabacteria bacterium]